MAKIKKEKKLLINFSSKCFRKKLSSDFCFGSEDLTPKYFKEYLKLLYKHKDKLTVEINGFRDISLYLKE